MVPLVALENSPVSVIRFHRLESSTTFRGRSTGGCPGRVNENELNSLLPANSPPTTSPLATLVPKRGRHDRLALASPFRWPGKNRMTSAKTTRSRSCYGCLKSCLFPSRNCSGRLDSRPKHRLRLPAPNRENLSMRFSLKELFTAGPRVHGPQCKLATPKCSGWRRCAVVGDRAFPGTIPVA